MKLGINENNSWGRDLGQAPILAWRDKRNSKSKRNAACQCRSRDIARYSSVLRLQDRGEKEKERVSRYIGWQRKRKSKKRGPPGPPEQSFREFG